MSLLLCSLPNEATYLAQSSNISNQFSFYNCICLINFLAPSSSTRLKVPFSSSHLLISLAIICPMSSSSLDFCPLHESQRRRPTCIFSLHTPPSALRSYRCPHPDCSDFVLTNNEVFSTNSFLL